VPNPRQATAGVRINLRLNHSLGLVAAIVAAASAKAAGVYMQIGTEGIGLGAGTGLSDNFGVRAEAN